jgi:nicotinamidase/pyrazinamidase
MRRAGNSVLVRRIVFWEVDAQSDFMLPGGKLYVPGAEKIIPNIQRLVQAARETRTFLVSSGDAHSERDPEFQKFPPHCLRGTPGAEIIPQGMAARFYVIPNQASFSLPPRILEYEQIILQKQTLDVFDNPHTGKIVQRLGEGVDFFVFGVVTEFCVRCAAKGLLERGRKVSIVEDATETLKREDGHKTLDELTALGARLLSTERAVELAHAYAKAAKHAKPARRASR